MDHIGRGSLLADFAVHFQAQRRILRVAMELRRRDKTGYRAGIIKAFGFFPRLAGFFILPADRAG
jgi:hypothetical protein